MLRILFANSIGFNLKNFLAAEEAALNQKRSLFNSDFNLD
jgi:hypothetical protein